MSAQAWKLGRNCYPIRLGKAARTHALYVAGGAGEAWERTICGAGGMALRESQWQDASDERVTCPRCLAALGDGADDYHAELVRREDERAFWRVAFS